MASNSNTNDESQRPVTLTVWTDPSHDDFLTEVIQHIVIRLYQEEQGTAEQRLFSFQPEMFVRNGTHCFVEENTTTTTDSDACELNCLYQGRYCSADTTTLSGNFVGSQLVLESARRQCLWNLYSNESSASVGVRLYFSYLKQLASTGCNQTLTTECIQKAYHQLGISMDDIDSCAIGGREEPNTDVESNAILERQIMLAEQASISSIPQVLVNGAVIDEKSMSVEYIFRAVCDAYDAAPRVCSFCLDNTTGTCKEGVSACLNYLQCNDNLLSEAGNKEEEENITIVTVAPKIVQEEEMQYEDMPETQPSTDGFDKLTALLSKRGMDAYQMLENCGVNMHAPMPIVNSILMGNLEGLQSGAEPCTGDNVRLFEKALQSFERHAGFDLMGWAQGNAESFGVAITGCMNAFHQLDDTEKIVKECVELFAVNDSLARSIGSFLEWNTMICPSLSQLQNDIPACIFQKGDKIAVLDGPLIQLSACLIGEVCDHLDALCETEVANLNECLPLPKDALKTCQRTEDKCKSHGSLLFMLPAPLFAPNFPERCQPFAVSRDKYGHAKIVERYNEYRRPCVIGEETMSDIKGFGHPDEHAGAESPNHSPKGGMEEGPIHGHFYLLANIIHDPLALGGILGLAIGCIIVCFFCSRLCRKRKKSGKENYKFLQTIDEDGEDCFNSQRYKDNFEDEALQPPSW